MSPLCLPSSTQEQAQGGDAHRTSESVRETLPFWKNTESPSKPEGVREIPVLGYFPFFFFSLDPALRMISAKELHYGSPGQMEI